MPPREYGVSRFADHLILLSVVLLAAVLRFWHLSDVGWTVDSDEAIVGLMAKHITEGADWPIFYYGQAYMGSLEAILAAGVFSLTGISSFALKAVPLFFSLVHVALVYVLALKFCSRAGAFIAALCTAAAPSALIMWSAKARGGFLELVVIGTLTLIVSVDILREKRPAASRFFLLGLLFGLGWWVNNQIIFYGVPAVVVFAVVCWRRSGLLGMLRSGALGSLGFVIGGAPFWWANLMQTPRFQSFWLFQPSGGGDFGKHLYGFFEQAFPIIIGARRFWADNELFSGSSVAAYILYALLGLFFALAWRDDVQKDSDRLGRSASWGLLALFLVMVPLIFAASRFGWLSQAPRYLLPMYSALFVLVGATYDALRNRVGTPAAWVLPGLVLALNLSSNYAYGGAVPGQPFVYKGQRVAKDQSELYTWLLDRNYSHIMTDYWIGYRTAFETQEQITFSRFRGPKVVRIPDYENQGEAGIEHAVFVLVPNQASLVGRGLRDLGYRFSVDFVGEYVVIHNLERTSPQGKELEIQANQLSASSRSDWLERLVDENLGTRWGSGSPQAPGMFVEVNLGAEKTIGSLELDYGFWRTDYPRELSIELIDDEGSSCVVFDTRSNEGLKYVVQESRTVRLVFPPAQASRIRLVQHGSHPVLDWSIAELSVFEAAESGSAEGE